MARTALNVRRALTLAGVAALVLSSLGAAALSASAQAQPAPQLQEGRYVIVHSPYARADTMLIDTASGRTWNLVSLTDVNGEPKAWSPIRQLNSATDRAAIISEFGLKRASAAE